MKVNLGIIVVLVYFSWQMTLTPLQYEKMVVHKEILKSNEPLFVYMYIYNFDGNLLKFNGFFFLSQSVHYSIFTTSAIMKIF